MKAIKHEIKHQYQPTDNTCSPTALSMLLGHYGKDVSIDDVSSKVPQVQDEKGQNCGTINTQMAEWCIELGFNVSLYTADCQVIDQSWKDLSKEELLERLELRKKGWPVPALGDLWTEAYTQSYIDFVRAGGNLQIRQFINSDLIYELLQTGPVLPCLSYSTLHGIGRSLFTGDVSKKDDINGRALNHSVVIYGNDEDGNFLVADPEFKPGLISVEPERMIAAIATGQLECDNLLFQIKNN